jgi:hypothetical protein
MMLDGGQRSLYGNRAGIQEAAKDFLLSQLDSKVSNITRLAAEGVSPETLINYLKTKKVIKEDGLSSLNNLFKHNEINSYPYYHLKNKIKKLLEETLILQHNNKKTSGYVDRLQKFNILSNFLQTDKDLNEKQGKYLSDNSTIDFLENRNIVKEDIEDILGFLKKSYKMGETMKKYIFDQTKFSNWREKLPVIISKFSELNKVGIDFNDKYYEKIYTNDLFDKLKQQLNKNSDLIKYNENFCNFLFNTDDTENRIGSISKFGELNALGLGSYKFIDGCYEKIYKNDLFDILAEQKDKILKNKKWLSIIINNGERVKELNKKSQLETYFTINSKIENSPSQEIKRLGTELLSELLESDNPIQKYDEIENIFIKNNVPLVGKVFGVFEVLHKNKNLQKCTSPILRESSNKMARYIIYKDLLNIHIKSGNRSLKEYAQIVKSGSKLVDKFKKEGFVSLTTKEKEEINFFVDKMETLLSRSKLDTAKNAFTESMETIDLNMRIQQMKTELKVRENQTFSDRIAEMYLKPINLTTFDELLSKMQEAKTKADTRGREYAHGSKDGYLELNNGDYLKGFDAQYISNILQNGSVAQDYLGSSAKSDQTPLDTDLAKITGEKNTSFQSAVGSSISSRYGTMTFAIKDRNQFQKTKIGQNDQLIEGKPELFISGNEEHIGIRTGFPSTEIDFIILRDNTPNSDLYFEIAQNGFYIPVTSPEGKIVFTPKMYNEYRKIFDGIKKFDGGNINIKSVEDNSIFKTNISEITEKIPEENIEVSKNFEEISDEIKNILNENEIDLKSEFDQSILGTELLDTGSTGRHTNMAGDYDFDLMLRLGSNDASRIEQIYEKIKNSCKFSKDNSHNESDYIQLRLEGVESMGNHKFDKPLSIDIGFIKKTDLKVYGTHDAISDRLENIKNNYGEKTYEQVLANIVLTKKILKKNSAYKKYEHGGIGGVGVENWLLANGGNIEKAFRSFRDAAYENGKRISLDEFRKKYKILDPGTNLKFMNHDNFTKVLKETGYSTMLDAIDKYIK